MSLYDSLVVVVEREGGPGPGEQGLGPANHQRVIMTRWWMRQGRKAGAREDPPTSLRHSLVAIGAGQDRGWGEKPPTSHNDSLVVGTRRAGAREDPPMSHNDLLVAVWAGEDRGWGK